MRCCPAQPVVHVPARPGALPMGHSPAGHPLGREFPAGPRRRWLRRAKDPGGWSAASMPPTRSAPLWARWASALWLVPWIGTQNSQRVLLLASALSGLIRAASLCLEPAVQGARARSCSLRWACAVLLAWSVHPIPGEVIAYGRRITGSTGAVRDPLHGGGQELFGGDHAVERSVHRDRVNGHVEATTTPFDMKLQRMVGHLPAMLHPNPKSMLGIGFGAGVSAGTFTRYPSIEKITICEIEPVIPPISTRFFGAAELRRGERSAHAHRLRRRAPLSS